MQLEMHLQEMQIDLENLMWDRKELEGHLKVATKEHRVMEMMLLELEEEHDKAIVKIELLESKVMTVLLQDLSQTTPMLVIPSNINIFVSFPAVLERGLGSVKFVILLWTPLVSLIMIASIKLH